MNTIKDFRNNLLKRKEIVFSVDSESNPGYAKMQQECANHFKIEPERVVVKKVWNNFGSKKFFAEVFLYDSVSDKDGTEVKPKVKKEAKK